MLIILIGAYDATALRASNPESISSHPSFLLFRISTQKRLPVSKLQIARSFMFIAKRNKIRYIGGVKNVKTKVYGMVSPNPKMKILVSLVLPLLFNSCIWRSSFVVSEEYSDKRFQNVSMTVNLPQREIYFKNKEEIEEDFGEGNLDSIYLAFFDEHFPKAVKSVSTVDSVLMSHGDYSYDFEAKEFSIGNKTIFLRMPNEGYFFPDTSRFILLVQLFNVVTIVPWDPLQANYRYHECNYFVWDNKFGRLVYYGMYNKRSSFGSGYHSARYKWSFSLLKLAETIFEHSPFHKIR